MAQKDFFAELGPLSRLRNFEPHTPMMPQLYREDRERMEDYYVEACRTKDNRHKQWRKDMHLMFQMIEGTKEEVKQKDAIRENIRNKGLNETERLQS